jgi:hypothetical protein
MTYIRAFYEDGKIHFLCTSCPWSATSESGKLWEKCPECESNLLSDTEVEPMTAAKDAKLEKHHVQDLEDEDRWKYGDYGAPFGDYGY